MSSSCRAAVPASVKNWLRSGDDRQDFVLWFGIGIVGAVFKRDFPKAEHKLRDFQMME